VTFGESEFSRSEIALRTDQYEDLSGFSLTYPNRLVSGSLLFSSANGRGRSKVVRVIGQDLF